MKSKLYSAATFVALTFLFAILSGCGTVKPKTPAQAIYTVEAEYNIALQFAVDYKNLPACGAAGVVVCSNPDIVKKLQDADRKASAALDSAEQVMLSPQSSQSDLDKALSIAQAALAVLTQLEASLKTK